MLATLLQKAIKIMQRRDNKDAKLDKQYLVVPNSEFSKALGKALRPAGLIVINDTGKKIGQLVRQTDIASGNNDSVVYRIPCSGCDSAYYGESYRGLANRIKEHRADVRHHRITNAIVNHIDDKGHLPSWENATTLEKGLSKQQRKVKEALYIATNLNINKRTGDIKWTKYTASHAVQESTTRSGRHIFNPG